jgi:hypothetical protein
VALIYKFSLKKSDIIQICAISLRSEYVEHMEPVAHMLKIPKLRLQDVQ